MKQKKSNGLAKILLAIDGSGISRNTAITSIELAKLFCQEILGLYVVNEELVVNDYADYQKELGLEELSLSRSEKAALFETRGHEILQWLKSLCQESGARVKTKIGLGGVGEMLLEQTQKASILAIGRRGNGHSDSSNHLGKNFRHIAHRSNIPLLVGGDRAKPLKKILVAYNESEQAKQPLFWAKRFLDHGLFKVLVLVVQEDDKPSVRTWEEEIKSDLSQNRIEKFSLISRRGYPADQIVETAMTNGSDLIIMGGYRHKALLEWLEGSTLDSVLKRIPLPVLVA
jgi:nucleotide-binding universal stress UspA family protein